MTAAGRSRAPGWYRDPNDPTRMRHWTGYGWEDRRRNLPAWSISTIDVDPGGAGPPPDGRPVMDGPVRPAPMPAVSARGGPGRSGVQGPLVEQGGIRGHGPGEQGRDGSDRGGQRRGRSGGREPFAPTGGRWVLARSRPVPAWRGSRNPMVVLAAFVGMIVLSLAAVVGAVSRDPGRLPPLAADTAFVQEANAACASVMGAARGPSADQVPTLSSVGSVGPVLSGTALAMADRALRTLASRLAAMGSRLSARPSLTAWLAGWSAWVAARDRLAADAASRSGVSAPGGASAAGGPGTAAGGPGSVTPAGTVASSGGSSSPGGNHASSSASAETSAADAVGAAAHRADQFALANGMEACTLERHPAYSYEQIP